MSVQLRIASLGGGFKSRAFLRLCSEGYALLGGLGSGGRCVLGTKNSLEALVLPDTLSLSSLKLSRF